MGSYTATKAVSVIIPLPPPDAPASLTVPSDDPDGSFAVSWSAASGTVHNYVLQERSSNHDGSWTLWANVQASNALTFSALSKGEGIYQYRVQACNEDTRVNISHFNILGQLTSTTDASGTNKAVTASYTYDANGNLKMAVIDGGSDGTTTSTLQYDAAGNRTQLIGPDVGTISTLLWGKCVLILITKGSSSVFSTIYSDGLRSKRMSITQPVGFMILLALTDYLARVQRVAVVTVLPKLTITVAPVEQRGWRVSQRILMCPVIPASMYVTKDRFVPIGERAIEWLQKYQEDIRPGFVMEPDTQQIFIESNGLPLTPDRLSRLVTKYIKQADIGKTGSCHLFRHTVATLMLDNGADIRFIQQMLGHAQLATTEIYTHVSIVKLKQIYDVTHPARRIVQRAKKEEEVTEEELLAALDAESAKDN